MKITIETTGRKETLDLNDYDTLDELTEDLVDELETEGIDLEAFFEIQFGIDR